MTAVHNCTNGCICIAEDHGDVENVNP